MRFTDKGVAALKPKAARYEIWEDGRTGFGIRVSPKGRKSWVWMYRFGGRPRRLTFGDYPKTRLSAARLKLAQAREQLDRGDDPGVAVVEAKRAERQAETVKELLDDYLEREAKKKRGGDEIERILRKEVEPAWGRRKAKSIKRRDVIVLLDEIVDRGAPVMANRTLAWTRRMFNFAIGRDIVAINPCWGVETPGDESERERALTDPEIKTFWHQLAEADMAPLTRLALKLILVTGQRPGEVAGIARAEIDEGGKLWVIPARRAKNGVEHAVPLSDLALAVIAEAIELERAQVAAKAKDGEIVAESAWLFPSPRRGPNGPMTVRAISHALRRNRDALGIDGVTPHDLRRTARTNWSKLRIEQEVRERLLNHLPAKLRRTYDRYDLLPEKRAALDRWGRALERIVADQPADESNVVASRSA